jgi:O-antigen/teichoic acid export membrane protein
MTPKPQSHLSSLAKHSTIYSLAPILQRFVGLILIRFYTEELNEAQYGVVGITDLVIIALTQMVGVNLFSGVVRFYFDHEEQRDRDAVVSSATLFLMAVSWVVVAIGLLLRVPLTGFLFVTTDPGLLADNLTNCVIVTLLIIPFGLTTESGFRYLQIRRLSAVISTVRIAKVTLEIALKIWMILVLKMGVIGFLLPILIGEVLTSVCLTGWVLNRVRFRFAWSILRPMLVYTAPLVLVGLFQMGLHGIDKLLLRLFGPEGDAMDWVGIYNLGYMIGFLVQQVVVQSFMQIWQPHIFSITDEKERARQLAHVSTYALFLVATVSLGVIAFGRELVNLLGGQEGYYPAWRIVPWITAGYVFNALNGLCQVPMFVSKRTSPLMWINALALAVNLGFNFLLIPYYGFLGAAIATLITFACLSAMSLTIASRMVTVPFEKWRIATLLATVLAVMGIVLWTDRQWLVPYGEIFNVVALGKAGLLAVALAFLWLGVLRAGERRELLGWLSSRLSGR